MTEFKAWPKISRLRREVVITEKIDGTNACIIVTPEGELFTQSRTRLITPEDDNYGFSAWALTNKDFLVDYLGEGYHYGEWWGSGIQRKYNMDEKVFSLFNAGRWRDTNELEGRLRCVPVICELEVFDTDGVDEAMAILKSHGSFAAPGFMNPEGIVIFHSQSYQLYKITYEKDQAGKGYGA